MEQNNRRNRYQEDDNRSSNYDRTNNNYKTRDNNYDRDRNFYDHDRDADWGTDYQGSNNRNQDMYPNSNQRNWNNRNDYNNNLSSGNRSYNRPDSSYMNSDNDRYSNDGWRDNNNRNSRNDGNGERGWWDKTKDEVSSWFGDDDAERRRRMDEYREGQHRGKGPKNYNRSKERIKEDASDRLSDDSLIDASNIEIEVEDNDLTLNGTVDTRYEKRRAEDLVENVSGVNNVQNNLRVVSKSMSNSEYSGMNANNSNSAYSSTKTTIERANNLS